MGLRSASVGIFLDGQIDGPNALDGHRFGAEDARCDALEGRQLGEPPFIVAYAVVPRVSNCGQRMNAG